MPLGPSPSALQAIPALIILALPLPTINHLFTRQIANTLQKPALLKLPRHTLIHTILDRIDVLVARDLGLVEFA